MKEALGSRLLREASLRCGPMAKSGPGECKGAQTPSYHSLCKAQWGGSGEKQTNLLGMGTEPRTPGQRCNRSSFDSVSLLGSFASPVLYCSQW